VRGALTPQRAPFRTFKEMIAYARANPGRLSYSSGLPGVSPQLSVCYGVCVPSGTPVAILDKLNTDIHSVLRIPEIQQRLTEPGIDVAPTTREEFDQFIRAEIARWAQVIKEAGIAQQ
jgi:tripartite-type tricarboxylate transporter receptor subunit TctC